MTPQTNIASIRKQIDREIVPEEAVLQGGGYKVMSTSTKAETEMRDRGCLHSCCSVERMCVYVKNHVCAYWYLLVRVLILLFTASSPSLCLLHLPPGASGGIIKRSQEAGWTVLSHCTRTIHGTERVMVLFLDEVGGTAGIDGIIGAQSAAAASAATGGTNRAVPGVTGAVVSVAGASESAFGEAASGAGRRSLGPTLNPLDTYVAVGDWDTASPRPPLLVGASGDSKHNDLSENSESSELTQDETSYTYASDFTDGTDNTDSFVDNTMLDDDDDDSNLDD